MGDSLGCSNNKQKHGEWEILQNYMMRVKGTERRPFVFILRLNIVLCDSYQADKIVMEIEEWKQAALSKALAEFY